MLGALGVSGDTPCADHNIAWRTRNHLDLDYIPNGVGPQKNDQIIYDMASGKSTSGFGHVACINKESEAVATLPVTKSAKNKTFILKSELNPRSSLKFIL